MKLTTYCTLAIAALFPMISSYAEPLKDYQFVSERQSGVTNFQGLGVDFEMGYSSMLGYSPYAHGGLSEKVTLSYLHPFTSSSYWGIEAYSQHNEAKYTLSQYSNLALDWNLGLDFKIGFLPTPSTLVFARAGYDQGVFLYTYQMPSVWGNSIQRTRFTRTGVAFGAGVEQEVNEQWFFKGGLDFRVFPNIFSSYGSNSSAAAMISALVSIGYKFPLNTDF